VSYLVDSDWLTDAAAGNPKARILLDGLAPEAPAISTIPIAERFAWLRSALRRQGMLIPDMDLLIAATALEHDLTLVTRNLSHFSRIPELRLA
jgi:predicted nucleic acid-binding protein